jgi:hypothetical protein
MDIDNSRSKETTSSDCSVENLQPDARAVPASSDNSKLLKKAHLASQREALDKIVKRAKQHFSFYHDGGTPYLKTHDGRLYPITKDDPGLKQLIPGLFSVLPTQRFYPHIISQLEYLALTEGKSVTVHRVGFYDLDTGALYVSRYDGTMVLLRPHQPPEVVPNGTNGVLFVDGPRCQPFSFPRMQKRLGPKDLDEAIWGGIEFEEGTLSMDEQRWLFKLFVLSLYFPELMRTRMILLVMGEKGSGKSFALRRIGQLVFGPGFEVTGGTSDLKDLDAVLTNHHFVALDNVDNPVDHLLDRIAGAATGQVVMKRKLFTTNEPAIYRMTAYLGITSRTPHFQRDDIVDRLLPLRVQRLGQFQPESELLHAFESKRDELMGLVVELLSEVVDALADNPLTGPSDLRIADFGAFAERTAVLFGAKEPREVLRRLQQAQAEFTADGDPILELVEAWVLDSQNHGRILSMREFRAELLALSRRLGLPADRLLQNQRNFNSSIRQRQAILKKEYQLVEFGGRARERYIQHRPGSVGPVVESAELPSGEFGEEGDGVRNDRKKEVIN